MRLRDRIDEVLDDYDSGYYSLDDTQWRLLRLVDEPEQVDALLACLPTEAAEGWLAWMQQFRAGEATDYIPWGGGPISEGEERSFAAVRTWLRDHPHASGRK
jgi:hypothetical protein